MNATTRKPQYSAAVDPHIYLPETGEARGCQTQEDWVQLALAALDQAGLSRGECMGVERILRDYLPDDWRGGEA